MFFLEDILYKEALKTSYPLLGYLRKNWTDIQTKTHINVQSTLQLKILSNSKLFRKNKKIRTLKNKNDQIWTKVNF